jgi:hypothetical protein
MKLITHHFSLTIKYKNGGIINEKAKNDKECNAHFRGGLQQVFRELSAEEFKRWHDQSLPAELSVFL